LAALLAPALAQATMVRLYTVLGPVDIELLDAEAPATVANFLDYVRSGAYDSSFIHRRVPGFIVQGGGYTWAEAGSGPVKVPARPPVVNEFSPTRSNLRATVAMAKVGANPPTYASINSATSEWFVNLANNAANLDNQNGGFTVFGRGTTPSMTVGHQRSPSVRNAAPAPL
jgi:peptidyl-prolyl cis-trans isomerase A (cyclophilin A)